MRKAVMQRWTWPNGSDKLTMNESFVYYVKKKTKTLIVLSIYMFFF